MRDKARYCAGDDVAKRVMLLAWYVIISQCCASLRGAKDGSKGQEEGMSHSTRPAAGRS